MDGNVKGFLRRNGRSTSTGEEGNDAELGALVVTGAGDAALEVTQPSRYGGGKTPVTATVTASGDNTILTPGTGNKIQLYWISAINDPDDSTSPLIKIKLGGVELYRVYAIAHWEIFTGPTNGALVINLDSTAAVAVTAHYLETT